MFANKKVGRFRKALARLVIFIAGLGAIERLTPDLLLEDGQDLSPYGFDATVLHLPGHSRGSISILTAEGDLFCGDLLENLKTPAVNTLGDDRMQMLVSAEKLKSYPVKVVYPGHGRPFPFEQLL